MKQWRVLLSRDSRGSVTSGLTREAFDRKLYPLQARRCDMATASSAREELAPMICG